MSGPFFIIGAQRSGTTLLRLILNSHSHISIPEEGTFWMPILRDCKHNIASEIPKTKLKNYFEYIKKNNQFKLWKIEITELEEELMNRKEVTPHVLMTAIYSKYNETQNKIIWGDKTPSFFRMIPIIAEIFPDAKFIHVVRDGRDIHLSLKKLGLYQSNVCVDALEWVHKVKKAQMDLNTLESDRFLEIRYEDLVSNFDKTIHTICTFLTLSYENPMVDFWKNSEKFIGKHHSKKIFQPVTTDSTKKWKKTMTKKELGKFDILAGMLLEDLGYEIIPSMMNFGSFFSMLCDLISGIPIRIARLLWTAIVLKISSKFGLATEASGKGHCPTG
ncbi:MAG: sulfotransferase [Desulfobacterales bacterium]|nr:sulfotransferase [Desulfobacterales bacterium]